MDKELEALLKEAHSMGASEADLDGIVGAFKKKIVSTPVSKGGVGDFGLGSNPFQPSVNTSTPIVKQLPVKYVKPTTKPKTLPEAVDDDNNYLGAVWNQIANSGSDFIGGMTRLIAKSNPYGSPVMAGVADELGNRASIITDNSFRTESSSKSNEEKIQSGFDLSNGISLDDAKALPLLISRFAADAGLAIPTAGASFIAQGYNTGLKEYDKATDGQPVDQNTRELFGIGYAGINGLLDKLSLGLITKSPTVAKGIKKTILGLGIKELAKVEGKITNEIIEQTFNKVAKQSFNKIKTAGVKAFTSGAIEGSTESGQGALSDGLKLLTNKLSDKEIFNKEEIVEGFLANRLNDFGGGAILGGVMGGGVALMSSKSIIAKRVAESTTPEQLDLLKNEIASEVEAGTIDTDRAESLMVAVDKYAGAKQKLPADLSTKQTEKALDTIIERDAVAEAIKQKTEQAAKSDEALAPQTQQELDLLEAKRQSLNDNIVEVTSDAKYSYSLDPESGKYFKQLGEDGKPEEITEQQYKLEKQVAPKTQPIIEAIDTDLIEKQFEPIADEMVKLENELSNQGYELVEDYDNGTQIRDKKTGDQLESEDLPDNILELAGKYEEAVQRIGGQANVMKILADARKRFNGEDAEFTELPNNQIAESNQQNEQVSQEQTNLDSKPQDDLKPVDVLKDDKTGDAKLPKGSKYVYHHTDNETIVDLENRENGTWFTENKQGYRYRRNAKKSIQRIIKLNELNLATEKQFNFASSGSVADKIKALKEQGFDGVKQVVDGEKEYLIFDINKTKPQENKESENNNGEQVTGEPTNTDTAVETNQGAGAINQVANNPDVSEVGGEAVNEGAIEGTTDGVSTVLQKAETDLAALKQVENKSAKYEGSVKRLTKAKNAGQITEQEFNDLLKRFNNVMAEYTPKGAKAVNLNESIPNEGYILDGEVKKPSAEKLTEIKARRDAAYKRVRAKGAQANTLFSPEVISDLVEIGSTYIEEGIVRFSDFAERLQKEYGKEIPTSVIKEVYEKSAEANGLGVRKFPESVQNSELSQEVKKVVLDESNPYIKQQLDDIETKVDAMSEADKIAAVAELSAMTDGKDGDSNFGVLAGFSLLNSYSENGEVEKAGKIADMLSRAATVIAQTLRQFGQLKKLSAASFLVFVEKHLGEKGRKLTPQQKIKISELFEAQKAKFKDFEVAQENYLDDLGKDARKKYLDAKEGFDNTSRDMDNYLEALLPKDIWDKLSTMLKGGLLTFKSLISNPIYNIFYLPIRFSKGEVANSIDWIISNTAGTPRTKTTSLSSTSAKIALQSIVTGVKSSVKKMNRGSVGADLAKYDVDRRLKPLEAWKNLLSTDDEMVNRPRIEKVSDFLEGTIGIAPNIAFRLLPFGDDGFFELAKNHRLYEIAKTMGLSGDDLTRFMVKPDDDSFKDATAYGKSATFQDDNGLSTVAKAVLRQMEQWGDKIDPNVGGFIKLLSTMNAPFIKTPASVVLKTITYAAPVIPVINTVFLTSDAIKATVNYKANPSETNKSRVMKAQRQLSESVGDVAVAVAINAVARIIVANGLITGSAPEEKERKKERDFYFATQPPFTLNISGLKRLISGEDPTYKQGDTAISYNQFGIAGAIFGIVNDTKGAELREEAKKSKKVGLSGQSYFPKEESNFKFLKDIVFDAATTLPASVRYVNEQSFLQSVESLMGAISKGDYNGWYNQMFRTSLNLVVPNTFVQANRAFRDTMKNPYTDDQVQTFINIAKERIGSGDGLPDRLDIWGQSVKQTPDGADPIIFQALDPFRTQTILNDPITYKVFDIQRKSGNTDAIPPTIPKFITIRGERRDLTMDQHIELSKLVGDYRRRFVDVTLRSYTGQETEKMERFVEKLQKAYSMGSDRGKKKFLSNNRELLR